MLNLTRKLLQGIARTLARYASSIEKRLARENSSANHPISDYSDERPPAHWLAKVRQGAPHLLTNRPGDGTQTVVNSSESSEIKNDSGFNSPVSADMYQEPPAHWIKRVRRGAPHLLDEQPFDSKNTPKHFAAQDRELPQPPDNQFANEIDPNKEDEDLIRKQSSISKTRSQAELNFSDSRLSGRTPDKTWSGAFDDSGIFDHNPEIQHDATRQKDSAGQTKGDTSRKAEKPFSRDPSAGASQKKTAIKKTESKQIDQTSPPAKRSEVRTEQSFVDDRQHRTLRLNTTISDATTQNKKYRPQYDASQEQFTLTSRMRIKQHPQEKSVTAQQASGITAKPYRYSLSNRNTHNQHAIHEGSASNHDKTMHFFHTQKDSEHLHLNLQSIDRRLPGATAPDAADILSGSDQRQYTASIPQTAGPPRFDLDRWPDLPGEKDRRLRDDQWPELPEEKLQEPDRILQSLIRFPQLQKAVMHNRQSELEQRGIFWNG
ncbi:hypothetical protein SAMN05421690_102920 [Nitrosomonas sp. Nm51]|uniref:hypothetical protein n=1 Tax=Nitrosomonas sp. Nm51 TaxID=133720 RepID=UPI0008B4B965|nr:hypothetical protein [Nitrosomonas sp. Nm51]SER47110.1 hypothetical protein SAMN05421690_102920 [Nitrosomonas sp. Nm51]